MHKIEARMKNSAKNYQAFDVDTDEASAESVLIHVVPENKSRWNHIEDLDAFFARVYHYHQHHGFTCMVLQEFLELLQFLFVVWFSTFLLKCVNYSVLFRDDPKFISTAKITLEDVFQGSGQCVSTFGPMIWGCLVIAFVFWILRVIGFVYHLFQYWEMRIFYKSALHIGDGDLENLTWHEVQQKLRAAQHDFQMCIHKQELTELDIYHRILRFKNYTIAMVNKAVLPLKFNVPFLGETVFLTRSLKFNIEFLLFWGPWAPFDNSWHLRDEYKRPNKRRELAQKLAKNIYYLGIFNFCLAPLILLWQVLYAFFSYAEIVKREPGNLGTRRWSLYGRLQLRHFNELDHELQARLSRAHRPATRYLSGFTSNLVAVIARNIAFLAGAILAVLVMLTIYDEDVIAVEHILSIMTVLGAVVHICRSLIPEENLVWCPESCMEAILAQVHYLPTKWKDHAHTAQVRAEFTQLFQYKAVYLLEELISPLVTPFILCCSLRHKALEIVDFLRLFTVEVVGVGDVCSFAQLDIERHGHPQWQSTVSCDTAGSTGQNFTHQQSQSHSRTEQQHEKAEDGKTELSLVHFALTNPEWKPPRAAEGFLTALRSQIHQELITNPLLFQQSILSSSGDPYPTLAHSLLRPNFLVEHAHDHHLKNRSLMGRGIAKNEGPRILPENKLFTSSKEGLDSVLETGVANSEPVAINMAVSTLYFHDMLQRCNTQQRRAANSNRIMPGIRESPDELEHFDPASAVAALASAVDKLPDNGRMAKSN